MGCPQIGAEAWEILQSHGSLLHIPVLSTALPALAYNQLLTKSCWCRCFVKIRARAYTYSSWGGIPNFIFSGLKNTTIRGEKQMQLTYTAGHQMDQNNRYNRMKHMVPSTKGYPLGMHQPQHTHLLGREV
jgi:hypothetical protein